MITFFMDIFKKTYRIVPKQAAFLAVNSILGVPIVPIQLHVTKQIVDLFENWKGALSVDKIMFLAVFLSILYFVNFVFFGSFNALALNTLYAEVEVEKEFMILDKTNKLPMLQLEAAVVADKRQRALNFDLGEAFNEFTGLIRSGFTIITLIIILIIKGSWIMAGITFAAAYLSIFLYSRTATRAQELARKQTGRTRFVRYLSEIMMQKKSLREIRIFGAENYLKDKWRGLFNKNRKEKVTLCLRNEKTRLLPDLIMAVLSGILSVIIAITIKAKKGTAGDFVFLFQAAVMLYSTLPMVISAFGRSKAFMLQWEDFTAFMRLPELEKTLQEEAAADYSDLGHAILEVSNLSFLYPGATQPAINNLSFKLQKGCKIALVGENGSGKSTLIKLLLGLYKPDSGFIKWYEDIKKESSAVFQDYGKYYLTVRENVALGNLELLHHNEKLYSSLTKAQVIEDLKLDDQLGANFSGRELSGGQWQRLATARAYIREGNIIFFDEPTAAMDPKSEQKAFKTFLDIAEGKTAILVTHRLGAARLADTILVLKEGRLVEQGNHEELIEAGGEYSRMYSQQSSWYK